MISSMTASPVRRLALTGAALLAAGLMSSGGLAGPAAAQDFTRSGVEDLVDDARRTVRDMDDESRRFSRDVRDAVGIMIFPRIVKAGFVFAVEGGAGLAMGRYDALDPPLQRPPGSPFDWTAPAFFNLAAGSVGFQIGASGSEVVLVFLSERSFERALNGDFEIGGDINVTVINQDERADTTHSNANVVSYALAGGLFAGLALEGSNIGEAIEANDVYYGERLDARDIVTDPSITNPQADRLRELLTQIARRGES